MNITEIPFVGLPVTDIPKSREFYEKVLGLKLTMLHELAPGSGQFWIEYDIGQSCLAISNIWPPNSGPGGPTVALEVDDLDKAIDELKEAGVEPDSEIMQSPACRFFLFKDLDGNPIMLHQMKAGE